MSDNISITSSQLADPVELEEDSIDEAKLHYNLLISVETIKQKVTDKEYKDIIDSLVALKKGTGVSDVVFNKAILTDIQEVLLRAMCISQNGHQPPPDSNLNLAMLRPLEGINYVAEIANIITNIETLTKEDDDILNKRNYIFKQLGTSFTGDYHRTALQMLDYVTCKRLIYLIDQLRM
jgi:hypothetical protein